ncbi:MAG: proprotein convertase P-domain-containing protein [Ferruginibacter sp.]
MKPFLQFLFSLLFSSLAFDALAAPPPSNDDPCNATPLTVGATCNYVQYTNDQATATAGVPAPGCASYSGGDVWFSVVVPASGSILIDTDDGVLTDGGMALYTGPNCSTLSLLTCDDDGSANGLMPSITQTGLTPGSTVYIRFWEYGNNNNGTFSICVKAGPTCNTSNTNSTCATADPFCTGVSYDYCNTTGVPSLGSGGIYGCLGSAPNPAFYFMNIATTGPVNFQISQQTYGGVPIDVDFVLWGPFANQAAMCGGISAANIVACSYSTAAVETASIPTATAGQWYMILITNYADLGGVINFSQTNANSPGAGSTNCNILTAIPGACTGGLFTLTGTVTIPSPPASGTLTITNSCGGSQVINAPFNSQIPYSIPNLCGNGLNCTVSAVFSASGAPTILPTTYTQPSCNTLTVTPGPCTANTYVLSGTLTTGCLPASGTLTITNSCGGSVTFNAPFTSPLNWTLPASSGNGGSCTVTAVYSAAGAPVIAPVTFNEPTCCGANAGTTTVAVTNGTQTTLANGTTQVLLCQNGTVSLTSNNNYNLPPNGCASCLSELIYAIYSNGGPTGPDPETDPNWTGYYWTGDDFPGNSTAGYNTNTSGSCSPILNLPDVAGYAPINDPLNTLVFVPITADDGDDDLSLSLSHDTNGDGCFDIGNPISITYLNPITFQPTVSCNGTVNVDITGGSPQIFPGLYTLTNTGAGTLSSTSVTSGGSVTISGLNNGQTYSFTVNDGTGCTKTFSGVYNGKPTVTINPASATICAGQCVNLSATINPNVNPGNSTFSNNTCVAIPDGGIAGGNTGQVNTGTWASSPITISGFCGTNWASGQTLNVCLNISHTWDADLNIFLQAPNGVIVTLSDDNGGGNANYSGTCFSMTAGTSITAGTAPFGGTYTPEGTFNAFNGTSINGTWTLWVGDDVSGDIGNINNWSITFTNQNTYTYSWTPATGLSATNILNPVACPTSTTTYTLKATNSCGCVDSAQTTITVTSSITPTFNPVAPICYGATAPVLPTTSTNGITGTWAPATVSNTNTATYTFTPTAGQCAVPTTLTVTVYDPIVIYASGTNPTCDNICNGSATVTVTGGTAPYTYSWSNSGNTQTITGLCVGTYSVTVTDFNGCTSSSSVPFTNNCFQIQSILVDACSPSEYDEEMAFFQVGANPLNTASMTATWPTAADPWRGLCANPAFFTNVNPTITGGGTLLPLPPSGILPANANVVIITGTPASSNMSFANLSGPLYVLFQCPGNTQGHFGNNTAAAGIKTLTLNFGAGCVDSVKYDNGLLVNQSGGTGGSAAVNNGAFVNYSTSGTGTYLNSGCVIPNTIQSNQVILTAPAPVTPTFNPVAPICNGATSPVLPLTSTNGITGTWNPSTVSNTASGTYTFTPAAGSCANTTTLTVTVNQPTSSTTNIAICPSQLPYNWNGQTYNGAGTYSVTLTGSNGCDSVATLNLTIKPTSTSTTNIAICPNQLPYFWNSQTYNSAGTFSVTLTGANGCDSVATLNLTIKPTSTSTTNIAICPNQLPYSWNSQTYNAAGTFSVTLIGANGCDSVATLNLTIKPISTTNIAICPNQLPYSWNSQTYNAAGTFSVTLTGANGCDSVATLNLTIKPITTSTTNIAICPNQLPYSWNSQTYNAAGTFSVTLTGTNGCDSVATLNLTIKPTSTSTTNIAICQPITLFLEQPDLQCCGHFRNTHRR